MAAWPSGPKPRSYAQRTPKKMVRLALLSALSDRADTGRVLVVDDWKIEAPRTKDAATIVRKLKLTGTTLVVLAQDELDVERSFANLPQVQTTTFAELSAHDVLRADWLVFSDRTLPAAASDFSGTHVVEEPPESPAVAEPAGHGHGRREGCRHRDARRQEGPGRHEDDRREDDRCEDGRRRRRPPRRPRLSPSHTTRPQPPRRRPTRRPTAMRDAMSVLIRPVVSEKSYALMDRSVYVFIVDPRATKIEVRHAVEQAFSVRVTKVNTLNRKGKATRNRRTNVKGKRPDTKRAIVTLHPDDSIDLFDR